MVKIISILSVPFAVFYGKELIHLVGSFNTGDPLQLIFSGSLVASAILFYLTVGSGSFVAIFEHEFTHNLMAVLTFRKPVGFHVEKGVGGLFTHHGSGNMFIVLAPYFVLTLPLLIFPLYWIIDHQHLDLFFGLLGSATGFHIATTIKESHPQQPDLRVYGLFFSYVLVLFFNILSFGVLFAFVQNGVEGVIDFFRAGFYELSYFITFMSDHAF